MPKCKAITPQRGWLRVLWPKQEADAFYTRCLQTQVGEIPGCKLDAGYLDLPYTVWGLELVQDLLEALEIPQPQLNETMRYAADGFPMRWGSRELYDYQAIGAEHALDHRGVIIADAMGLGKTSTAAVAAELVRRQEAPRPVLIISTKAVRQTWRDELTALGILEAATDFCAIETRDFDDKSYWKGAKYYFIHFEIAKAWYSVLSIARPCVAIIDEAHYIKHGDKQRSQGAAIASGHALRKILLTGTPMENQPSDLWHLLTVACGPRTWGHPNGFRVRYCGAEHDGWKYVDKLPTNVHELQERLKGIYLRRTPEDAGLKLPEFVRQVQHVDLGAFQKRYDALIKELELYDLGTLESLVRAIAEGLVDKVLPELTKLRQLTSRAKIPSTVEYAINAIEQGEGVVVFAWERETAEKIFDGLGGTHILAHGGHSQAARDAAIAAFQAAARPTALVTTFGAMREGVTLHRARLVVLHDLDWTLSSMLQAEKRVHRLGQNRNCVSTWMLAKRSMDTLIAPILLRKADLMEQILGIRHDIKDVGLTELAGRTGADAMVERVFASWDGALQ